ncbi:HD domain-containing protein [Patescibacteria group bacterium]|nr:HD domain-containing protein [Patescibacteria group bacterium]
MDPYTILQKYYDPNSKAYKTLVEHSEKVRDKALKIADNVPELNPDKEFIKEAAMLHDIGLCKLNIPENDYNCSKKHYIQHSIFGREILENEGLPQHALVCERHMGGGIDKQQIIEKNLPLPVCDMRPRTIEEKIICVADKFFRKSQPDREQTIDEILALLTTHSPREVGYFKKWMKELKI